MGKGFYIDKDVIVINRDLTQLDFFVRDFLDILKRHTDYLIVSGFVSISTGRTRGTEDVDVLVPITSKDIFKNMFAEEFKQNARIYLKRTLKKRNFAYF